MGRAADFVDRTSMVGRTTPRSSSRARSKLMSRPDDFDTAPRPLRTGARYSTPFGFDIDLEVDNFDDLDLQDLDDREIDDLEDLDHFEDLGGLKPPAPEPHPAASP